MLADSVVRFARFPTFQVDEDWEPKLPPRLTPAEEARDCSPVVNFALSEMLVCAAWMLGPRERRIGAPRRAASLQLAVRGRKTAAGERI